MLPEVKAYLTDNFQWFVYLFALATPVGLALLAYVIRGILNLTIWYDHSRRQPYSDPFFWIAIALVAIIFINGFYTFIGEVREYLSQHPKSGAWYHNVPFHANNTLYGAISLIAFIAGAVVLYLTEKREKFLGAVPFYTILIFLFVTPIFYNVQFEREGLLPKEAAGCILGLQLICFTFLHWALNRRFKFISSNIHLPLGLLMAWSLIGFFIFPHQLAAVKNLKQMVTFAAIFFSIACFVKSEKHLRVLFWIAIIAANISVAWGLMRFFGVNLFGLPETYFQEPKAGKSFLLSGFFANPNYFSEYLAIIIFMCIGLGIFTRHRGAKTALFVIAGVDIFHLMMTYTRAAWVGIGFGAIGAELLFLLYILRYKPLASRDPTTIASRSFLTNFLAAVIAIRVLIMLLAFYLMFSKGLFKAPVYGMQILGLAVLALELWLFTRARAALRSDEASSKGAPVGGILETPLASAGICVVALLIIFGSFHNVTKNLAAKTQSYPHAIAPSDRAASLADFKGDETFRNRLNMWRVGLEMIRSHPIFGYGLGSYEIEYLVYQDKIVSKYSFEEFSEWFHNTIPTFRAHNDHLQLLCELGILGFIFWVWFWVAVFSTAWRGLVHGRNFGERFFVLTIFASMVCINIAASFSFPFHKIQTGGLIFMLIGVLGFIRHRQMHPPAPPAAAKKPRQPMKNPKKARAKAPSRAMPPAAVSVPEPDIGEYESYHRPPALRMLKGLVFAVALLLTALGMYTQIQHFRSNTFFSWGTRFISAKYSNDYNSSRDFWFKRATELNPSNGRAEFFWGWATSKTEQYVEAAELLRHAQGLYPQTDTHYTLGLTLTWHGNKLMAEGNEAEGMRKYNEAIDALMFASQRLPTRLEYYTELVKLLNRLGRFEEAEKYSERAITVYQWVTMAQNVEYMFYLWKGQALIAQDKIDEAIETLEEATTLVYDKLPPDRKGKPVSLSDQPQAYLLLGQAYEKKGDFENAEYHYNKYLTKNNNLKKEQRANDILFFQGRLFEKMGDVEPDEESKLKYKDWAEQKYVLLVKLYDDFERFKEKIGSERPSSQRMTEFTSKNGRPISEKIYRESLSGLERIKAGEPYPAMEEMVLIESETVGVGEAELVKLDED